MRSLRLATLLLVACSPADLWTAAAQNRNAGELRGTVVDSTGAAVPGAEVHATEASTGSVVKSVTDNSVL